MVVWSGLYNTDTEFAKCSVHYNVKHDLKFPRYDSLTAQIAF